ncbi:MAG: MBL fold metallo-hydrolase [Deltaproteobacteria bacterium]|jgi:hydroxyacylglutathione hydrolase|nr:MBL fold metallo-hydrolase [Deltaproteobacteria bacterium]
MKIFKIPVTTIRQNCRIVVDEKTKASAVVDPGGEVAKIFDFILEQQLQVTHILLTHAHFDHAGGVQELLDYLEALEYYPLFLAHKNEAQLRAGLKQQLENFGMESWGLENCPEPQQYLSDGEIIEIGNLKIKTLFTPGHSPGHLSFFIDDSTAPCVITGDALFKNSIGRTDLPGANHQVLIKSIKEKLLSLPLHTLVLPGHGSDSSIQEEIKNNPYLQ